jgi:hypothetical protein
VEAESDPVVRKIAFLALLALTGCQLVDDQLKRDPKTGASKLEEEVRAAQPLLGPYGTFALAGATLITSIGALFHSREANKQTDEPKA